MGEETRELAGRGEARQGKGERGGEKEIEQWMLGVGRGRRNMAGEGAII